MMDAKRYNQFMIAVGTAYAATLPFSGSVYAGGGDSAHPEGGTGFPQLDTSTYASQIFWLFVSFIVMYFIMSRIALPRIAYVLDMRETQKRGNLTEAERLNNEAESALENYETVMAKAHEEARTILSEANQEIGVMQAKNLTSFQDDIQAKLATTEKNIQNAVDDALSTLTGHASELTGQAAGKLGQLKLTKTETNKVVTSVWKNTKDA